MADKRAVIYARVSTDDQRSNYSIPTQIADCLAYAKKNGYSIVGDRFVDGTTGLDTASDAINGLRAYVDDYTSRELSRPALDEAFDFADRVGFDVLIVFVLDRLARDPYIRQTLEREFQSRGVRVHYVHGNYDDTPEGEVRKDLDATFGKWENAKRVERSTRGKRGKAERGLYVQGRAPFGYVVDPDARPAGLRIIETQAAVVREIFDLYANQNYSIRQIARILTERGIPTREGKTRWGKQTVAFMLTNETYAGTAYYNKSMTQNKREVPRDRSAWIPISVTPIVDREVFRAVQLKLAHNRSSRRRMPNRFYLLSGMIQCAICHRAYVSQAIATHPGESYYRYYVHRKRDGACHQDCRSARKLEDRAWREVVEAISDPEQARIGYAAAKGQLAVTTKRKRAHLETLERNLIKAQQRHTNLNAMYTDPDIKMTKSEYLTQKSDIDEHEEELRQQIEALREELAAIPQPADLATFEVFTAEIRAQLARHVDPSPEKKRQLLEMLHVKVLVTPKSGTEVTGWYKPKFSQSSKPSP